MIRQDLEGRVTSAQNGAVPRPFWTSVGPIAVREPLVASQMRAHWAHRLSPENFDFIWVWSGVTEFAALVGPGEGERRAHQASGSEMARLLALDNRSDDVGREAGERD